MTRRVPLLLALLCGCRPEAVDTADPRSDSGAPDTGADTGADTAADTGTDTAADTGDPDLSEPPLSSRCIVATDDIGFCASGVYADDWAGTARYQWLVTDGYRTSEVRVRDGGGTRTIATVSTSSAWLATGGLAVLPDGDLVLGGITLTNQSVTVGDDTVPLGPDYARFIVRLAPDGTMRWARAIIGITGEPVVTMPRADGSALVSGVLFQDTTFGSTTLKTALFFDLTFVAAIDAAGTWLWASAPGVPADTHPRFYFEDAIPTADGGTTVTGSTTATLQTAGGDFVCPVGSTCPATATVAADGTWMSIVAR